MSGDTKIPWCSRTWNVTAGCSRVSPGCENCWAIRQARRRIGGDCIGLTHWQGGRLDWTGKVRTLAERLDWPLHWRKPETIFICAQSDLFHPLVPFEFIAQVLDRTMWSFHLTCRKGEDCRCECDHDAEGYDPTSPDCRCWSEIADHAYIVLTKRPERMLAFFDWLADRVSHAPNLGYCLTEETGFLSNVWLGTSVESRAQLARLEALRNCPGGFRRWVSFEPLLEDLGQVDLRGIQAAVAGGESGSKARPCDVAWIRSLRDQCQEAGVRFMAKQMGSRPYESQPMAFHGCEWCYERPVRGCPECAGLDLRHPSGADPKEWPEDLRHFAAPPWEVRG